MFLSRSTSLRLTTWSAIRARRRSAVDTFARVPPGWRSASPPSRLSARFFGAMTVRTRVRDLRVHRSSCFRCSPRAHLRRGGDATRSSPSRSRTTADSGPARALRLRRRLGSRSSIPRRRGPSPSSLEARPGYEHAHEGRRHVPSWIASTPANSASRSSLICAYSPFLGRGRTTTWSAWRGRRGRARCPRDAAADDTALHRECSPTGARSSPYRCAAALPGYPARAAALDERIIVVRGRAPSARSHRGSRVHDEHRGSDA